MPNLERQHVYREDYQFFLEDFDGKPVAELLSALSETVDACKADYPDAVALNIKDTGGGWFEIRVYELETDEQYETRISAEKAEEQAKAEKERARDLATLKRLQAKYPDVTIEG